MTDQYDPSENLHVATPCVGEPCTNDQHDHFGMIEEMANVGVTVTDDRRTCADCDAPTHYDSGDEQYHHDNPEAPACFLIRS